MKRAIAPLTVGLMSGCQLNFASVGAWAVEASPPAPITADAAVPLADGRVALFGGFVLQTGQPTAQVLLFDPRRNEWEAGAPMPEPLGFGAVVARLHDGSVLVAGGQGASGLSADTWLYDPGRNSWSRAGSMQVARILPSFAVLTDGRVLVAGGSLPLAQPVQLPTGQTITDQAVASTEIFDPATKAWSAAGQLNAARTYVALVALPHGKALAAGGCAGQGYVGPIQAGTGKAFTAAELFDPETGGWTFTTPLPEPRCGARGVTLPDGRALLTGGDQGSASTAMIFDPQSNRWGSAATIAAGPSTPLVLVDGRVLLPNAETGPRQGRVGTMFIGGQVFEPASNDWNFTTTASVPVSGLFLQQGGALLAVALPDGNAIVLLETVALIFHPATAPPSGQALDSSALTLLLLAVSGVLGLLIAVSYVRGRTPSGDAFAG